MKARKLLIVLTVAAVTLLVIWLFRPTSQMKPQNPPPEVDASAPNRAPDVPADATKREVATPQQQPQRENLPDAQGNWALEPLPPGRTLQERLEELARRRGVPLNVLTQQALAQWSNAWQQASEEVNGPIQFYGKAVDENGMALQGAGVNFSWLAFPENRFETNGLTDSRGMFELNSATGMVLFVYVTKDGYEQGTNQNRFEYHVFGFEGFRPDPSTPAVFHLQKKVNRQN